MSDYETHRLQTALDAQSLLGRIQRRTTGREEECRIGCFHQEPLATFNCERGIISGKFPLHMVPWLALPNACGGHDHSKKVAMGSVSCRPARTHKSIKLL
jgi:hypothetical protein